MTIGSAAYLGIEWIDMVFNTSGPTAGYEERGLEKRSASCGTVCAVDGIRQPGFPEVVPKARASVVGNSRSYLTWGMLLLLFALLNF